MRALSVAEGDLTPSLASYSSCLPLLSSLLSLSSRLYLQGSISPHSICQVGDEAISHPNSTMASLLLTACLSLSAAALVKGDNEITWGSVVFTYHGEKIPNLYEGPNNLTPLGANQLLQAGQTIRNRYINGSSNGSQITTHYPINGLSVNGIDNSQMEILTMTDEYLTASALAFMQGLYPPRSTATEVVDEESIMGNGSLEQFPLNGYATSLSIPFPYSNIIGCFDVFLNVSGVLRRYKILLNSKILLDQAILTRITCRYQYPNIASSSSQDFNYTW
jgi:hypothetical protein